MERTLLLIDDEPNIVSALTRLFRRDHYHILSANSGEDGLGLLKDHQVGVILSDQRMPAMTGTEFLTQAKVIQPQSVRIVLSGYTELNSVTDAINRGSVFRFLTKPWEDELLREQVRDAFSHYELKQNNQRLTEELREKNEALEHAAKLLENTLATTVGELDFGMSLLKTTQQILHQAPVAIVGYTPDGMIAVANHCATTLFPGLCLGQHVASCLPDSLLQVASRAGESGVFRTDKGKPYYYQTTSLYPGTARANATPTGLILTLVQGRTDTDIDSDFIAI